VRSRRLHTDYIVALVILAFCAGVFALTFAFDTVPAALAVGMGPAAFPRLILAVMALLALVLAVVSRGRAEEAREPVPAMVWWTALAMLAFMGLLWLVGMAVAMAVAVVGLGALWGERRWLVLAASGVGLSLAIYVFFTKAFGIPLPAGFLAERLF
jgi:putative tricarboxylic transport membrane protein